MKTANDIFESLLKLSDDRFWGDVVDLFEDLEAQLLEEEEFEGVAINCPAKVDVTHFDSLPVILASREPLLRVHQVPAQRNTALAAMDLDTGRVYLGPALVDEKAALWRTSLPEPEREPVPDDAELDGATAMFSRINALARLRVPLEPARLALAIINYDWLSNVVEAELTGGPEPPAATAPAVSPSPADAVPAGEESLPSFEKNSRSPNPGKVAAFMIEGLNEGQVVVRGAFTFLARESHIPAEPERHLLGDGSEATAAAVVPVTLAVAVLGRETPLSYDWAVPAYSDFIISAGDRISGYFNIDLMDTPDPPPPGDHQAYLFIEGNIIGPVLFSVKEA